MPPGTEAFASENKKTFCAHATEDVTGRYPAAVAENLWYAALAVGCTCNDAFSLNDNVRTAIVHATDLRCSRPTLPAVT